MLRKVFQAAVRKLMSAFGGTEVLLPVYILLAGCFLAAAAIVTAKAPSRISLAVADTCQGPYSRELTEAIMNEEDIEPLLCSSVEEGEDFLLRGKAETLLIITPEYDEKILDDTAESLITLRTAPGAASANLLRETIAGILLARRSSARLRQGLEEDGFDGSLLEPTSREIDLPPLIQTTTAGGSEAAFRAVFGSAYACYEGVAALALILLLLTMSRRLNDPFSKEVSSRLSVLGNGSRLSFFSDAGCLFLAGLFGTLLAFVIGPDRSALLLAGLLCYTVCISGLSLLLSSFGVTGKIDLMAPFLALATSIIGGCFVDLSSLSPSFKTLARCTPQGQLIAAVREQPVFLVVLLAEGCLFAWLAALLRRKTREHITVRGET